MEEPQTVPFQAILAFLFLLPILAAGLLVVIRRSKTLRPLAPAILLSGATTSLLATCYGFSNLTMPIRPYEGSTSPWPELLGPMVAFLLVGFGIGVLLSSALAVPTWLVLHQRRRSDTPGRPPSPS